MNPDPNGCELSIVIPCLNEADSVGICVEKAVRWLRENNVSGEVILADNGSKDGSQKIAADRGALIVNVPDKGYGAALMGGIEAARGKYVIMGDADDSYDFSDLGGFITKLREGYDLVQGCRLAPGGGRIEKSAMPFLHKWWGNPMFSAMARIWFGAPVHDVYCGLRGFTVALYRRLNLRCTGMEFATEMVIKSSLYKEKIAEVPITLYPDTRVNRAPHLKTFRDGWRTLRFFLLYSPRWLFLMPAAVLTLLGLVGYALALPGLSIMGATLDAHTLLFASLAILCGFQAAVFAVFTKVFAITEGLLPSRPHLDKMFEYINLERGVIAGMVTLLAGVALLLWSINLWRLAGFGHLDYAHTMRFVIPGATLTALGLQMVFSSFFISILGMRRK
jgi:glycosyltransferase involved in cell wall biosynthesis